MPKSYKRPAGDWHAFVADLDGRGLDAEHGREPFRRERLGRCAVRDDPALVHHQHAVGEARRQRQVVHDGEDRVAAVRGGWRSSSMTMS